MHEVSEQSIQTIRAAGLQWAQSIFEPADKVYVIIEHVARSGMSRDMSFFVVNNGELYRVSALIKHLTGARWNPKRECITVRGCGMDMAWATVHEACQALGIPTKLHHIL